MKDARPGRTPHGPHVVGPVILITAGVILLLNNLGLLSWFVWWQLGRLWPILIVLFGLRLILRHNSSLLVANLIPLLLVGATVSTAVYLTLQDTTVVSNAEPGSMAYLDQPLGNLERANLDLSFGAGSLVLGSLNYDSNLLFQGSFSDSHGEQIQRSYHESGGTAYLSLRSQGPQFNVFLGNRPVQWDVKVAQQVPLNITLKSGATDGTIDLTDLRVTDLTADVGASRAEIRFPAGAGMTRAKVNAGAADLTLVVPPNVAARIKTPNVPFGVGLDVDKSRFTQNGSLYTTGDWNRADNKLEIEVAAGLAKLTLR